MIGDRCGSVALEGIQGNTLPDTLIRFTLEPAGQTLSVRLRCSTLGLAPLAVLVTPGRDVRPTVASSKS
jgi:hypothetical protein